MVQKIWLQTQIINELQILDLDIKMAINLKPADKKIVKDNKMMLNFCIRYLFVILDYQLYRQDIFMLDRTIIYIGLY